MEKRRKHKKINIEEKDSVLRIAVMVAVVLLAIGIIVVAVRLLNPKEDTEAGIKRLEKMEKTDVAKVDKLILDLEDEEHQADEEWANRSPNEKFANCLLMGDSVTQGLYEYQIMDQSLVQAERGAGVTGGDNEVISAHIAKAVELKPQKLFLAYGMNDIKGCNGDPAAFRESYEKVIKTLKEGLPDTEIYVNSILPVQQFVIEEYAGYAAIPQFNEQIASMCEQEGLTYIDNTDLVEEGFYADDGIHMSTDYYTKWINHMAEVARL